ncbi:WXG100 family type VII secretion target, partial [Herpetosiphon llansteffanensis]|uniref:WXG100 family type VII secretion target n=1 Tax=Herpetosiphon llansteffanensis TaxID=2094568 RepID=UPI0013DE7E3A
MAAPIVQADYEVLDQVAQRLSKNADSVTALQSTLKQTIDNLRSTWIGDASVAFQNEMQADLLPAVQRLINAFQVAQGTTLEIKKVLQQAEQEASGLFKGDLTGGGASTQGAGASGGGAASGGAAETATANASSGAGVMAGG